MAELTPEQEARRALELDLPGSDLPLAAQVGYDRLRPAGEREMFVSRERDAARRREDARVPVAKRVIPSAR